MVLSNLTPAKGSTKKRKRLGRGVGSGYGGHSSTRGDKGQKSRTGNHSMPAWFEGGQMPLQRRIPKFGFKNPFRKEYRIVNVSRLDELVEAGRLDAAGAITPAVLVEAGLAGTADRIKILGGGELSRALDVTAHAFSKSARQKIEEVGGKATVLEL
jgi:large subunit ribosomal protein L15